jgi:hypothetical protein
MALDSVGGSGWHRNSHFIRADVLVQPLSWRGSTTTGAITTEFAVVTTKCDAAATIGANVTAALRLGSE